MVIGSGDSADSRTVKVPFVGMVGSIDEVEVAGSISLTEVHFAGDFLFDSGGTENETFFLACDGISIEPFCVALVTLVTLRAMFAVRVRIPEGLGGIANILCSETVSIYAYNFCNHSVSVS